MVCEKFAMDNRLLYTIRCLVGNTRRVITTVSRISGNESLTGALYFELQHLSIDIFFGSVVELWLIPDQLRHCTPLPTLIRRSDCVRIEMKRGYQSFQVI